MSECCEPVSSVGLGTPPVREARTSPAWFREHFEQAAGEIVDFFGADGIDFADKEIADVGCGDGIIDLGIVLRGRPRRLVGFDILPTDTGQLLALARREGAADELPEVLEFRRSEPGHIPADDDSFDIVVSWSTFEHVQEPLVVLREIHRILRPYGSLMIQVWPLYHSQHGSHLWQYFPAGFAHLLRRSSELEAAVRAEPGPDPEWAEQLIEHFRSCNKITLDGLQRVLVHAGFAIHKLELLSETVHLPPGLEAYPLSQLGVSGVKLIAGAQERHG